MHQSNAVVLGEFAEQFNSSSGRQAPHLKLVKPKKGYGRVGTALRLGTALTLRAQKARPGQEKLSSAEMLYIAFGKRHNRPALADDFSISRVVVMRTCVVVAHTLLEIQLRLLRDLVDFASSKKPDIATACVMWDETAVFLAVYTVQGSKTHQQKSSWNVLCCRVHCALGWVKGTKLYREFVMPPIPLPTNSAHCMFNGLRSHPISKGVHDLLDKLLESAKVRAIFREADGHLGNEKLNAHLYNLERARFQAKCDAGDADAPIYNELVLCTNHQTHLVMMDVVQNSKRTEGTGGKLLDNMFCSVLWLRMGAHFQRLAHSIRDRVRDPTFFRWVQNPSSAQRREGQAYRLELASYLIDDLQHHARQMSPDENRGRLVL